jgi:hypothetical protein
MASKTKARSLGGTGKSESGSAILKFRAKRGIWTLSWDPDAEAKARAGQADWVARVHGAIGAFEREIDAILSPWSEVLGDWECEEGVEFEFGTDAEAWGLAKTLISNQSRAIITAVARRVDRRVAVDRPEEDGGVGELENKLESALGANARGALEYWMARAKKAEAELAEMRALALPRVPDGDPQAGQSAAPVPAAIEPLPKELEPILGRKAILELVGPASGSDSRSVIARHEVIWKRFDEALEARGPEGWKVLRKPLQDYLDGLVGLPFTRDEKQRIVARLNFMMRSLGVRASFGGAVGPLAVSGPSLRIQTSSQSPEGKQVRVYTGLGPVFSERIGLAEEPPRKIQVARKVTKPYRPNIKSRAYKYLRNPRKTSDA